MPFGLLGRDGFRNGVEERRLGREPGAGFFRHLHPVDPDGKLTAPARFQIGIEIELALDERRHTGGAGFVVSDDAIADRDPCHGQGSNCSRRFQGFQGVWFQAVPGLPGFQPLERLARWNPVELNFWNIWNPWNLWNN